MPSLSATFTLTTEAFRLVWRPKKRLPPSVGEEAVRNAVEPMGAGIAAEVTGAPRFLEQTDYMFFLQSRTEAPVAVHHRDPVLLAGVHAAEEGRIWHGLVNFGGQVGTSTFVVSVEGQPHVRFTAEVCPTKLDYRTDYAALRDDVQAFATALLLEYLRATVQPADFDPEVAASLAWVLLLREVLGDLEKALAHVGQHPLVGLTPQVQRRRPEQVARLRPALVPQIAQQQRQGRAWLIGAHPLPAAPLVLPHATASLDTPEHRWLGWHVQHLGARLAQVRQDEAARPATARQGRILEELAAMQARLSQLQRGLPGASLVLAAPPPPTVRLQRAPGYREAYQACTALLRGLRVTGGPLALGLKDLHLLYEYWCFLVLVRSVATLAGQPWPVRALLAVEARGLRFRLRQGRAQRLRFPWPGGGQVQLTYNPRFGGRHLLVPQQPDFLLEHTGPDGARRRFVLDAKYRLDTSPTYVRRYGLPGPPTDALNALHRYRDALLAADGYPTEAAVALYPFHPETPAAYATSRHAQALQHIGVGALPLLPGTTALLENWLRSVLTDG